MRPLSNQGLKQKEQRDFDSNGPRFWISRGKVGVPVVKLQNRKYCYRFTSLYFCGQNVSWYTQVLLHSSCTWSLVAGASVIFMFGLFQMDLIGLTMRFSHANLGTPRRFGPFGCNLMGRAVCMIWYYSRKYIVWLGDLLYFLQKKWDSSQDVFSIVLSVGSTLFSGASHIFVKWCLIISYFVSQPEVSVK